MVFALLVFCVTTFSTDITTFPLDFGKVYQTIFICFEAFNKLYEILTSEYFHVFVVFLWCKDMKLNDDLY